MKRTNYGVFILVALTLHVALSCSEDGTAGGNPSVDGSGATGGVAADSSNDAAIEPSDGAEENSADAGDTSIECSIGTTCSELIAQREALVGEFRDAIDNGNMEKLPPLQHCIREIVQAERLQVDKCGVSDCERICELHDCSTSTPMPECIATCEQQSKSLSSLQLDQIVLAAATNPVCTCDICSAETFSFCMVVWDCQAG